MTPKEFASKVDWEGGLYDAVVDYGLDHDDLDRDADPELWEMVRAYVEEARELRQYEDRLEALLDEYRDE